jgi:hypothetical protein
MHNGLRVLLLPHTWLWCLTQPAPVCQRLAASDSPAPRRYPLACGTGHAASPRQACALLKGVDTRVVVEPELKIALGLTKAKGHRMWRK